MTNHQPRRAIFLVIQRKIKEFKNPEYSENIEEQNYKTLDFLIDTKSKEICKMKKLRKEKSRESTEKNEKFKTIHQNTKNNEKIPNKNLTKRNPNKEFKKQNFQVIIIIH